MGHRPEVGGREEMTSGRSTWRRRATILLTAGVATIGLIGVVPTQATAAGTQGNSHGISYIPLRGAAKSGNISAGSVDYNGGPVMPVNTDYAVYWSPGGLGAYGPEYVAGINQYFTDLQHDSGGHQNVDSVSAQYNDVSGATSSYSVTFGGGLLDTDPYPASQCPVTSPVTNCLTDAQLEQEAEHFAATNHLPVDLSHEFFILTPPHVEGCFSNDASSGYGGCTAGELPASLEAYCAYHSNTTLSPMLLYADDPYVTGNAGCDDGNHPNGPSDGALEGGLSHEHNESITDPVVNDAWTAGAGPNHGKHTLHGYEVGDICETSNGPALGTASNGASFNQVINGHDYWYQEEWSNIGHTCLQRLGPVTSRPTATFVVTAGKGLTLNFDASASAAQGGVAEYVWQFNDSYGASTVTRNVATVSHTFPAAGAYSVGLTIFAPDGSSTGTGGIVTTGVDGTTSGFTSAPSSPSAHHTIDFSALGTVSNQPVITYYWNYGDGTTGSGQSPTHAYAAPGAYTVTLVMFSGVGSAYPGVGAGPMTTQTITVS